MAAGLVLWAFTIRAMVAEGSVLPPLRGRAFQTGEEVQQLFASATSLPAGGEHITTADA